MSIFDSNDPEVREAAIEALNFNVVEYTLFGGPISGRNVSAHEGANYLCMGSGYYELIGTCGFWRDAQIWERNNNSRTGEFHGS